MKIFKTEKPENQIEYINSIELLFSKNEWITVPPSDTNTFIITQKNNKLNNLKNKLNYFKKESINYNLKEFLPGEEIIAVMIKSNDQNIEYCLPCKNTTTFDKIEEKLYEEYPEYKGNNNYFLVNGKKVKRDKTIKENKIKNGNPVILIKEE